MAKVTKEFDGKRFNYYCNGQLYRTSKNDYRFACIAIRNDNGKEIPAALGNERDSTLKSNSLRYREYCKLVVVDIE